MDVARVSVSNHISMQNHFELFQLPQRFTIDLTALDKAYHEVQSRVHPDRFAHANDVEKRVAMQWATRVNEAYQTLKSPFKRAAYLCELNGIDLQTESNTAMPPGFLLQQMEWREALEQAKLEKDIDALEKLNAELKAECAKEVTQIGVLLDGYMFSEAAQGVRQLMFLEKIAQEVTFVFEKLDA